MAAVDRSKTYEELQAIAEARENRTIVHLAPNELLEWNGQANIYNQKSYSSMDGMFRAAKFREIEVVWVVDANGEGHYGIVDGHTRTRFAADREYPAIAAIDLTPEETINGFFETATDKNGKVGITMGQYLNLVIPPTKEHSEIAAGRIAYHLLAGWDSMVGHEVAEKFSAIDALSFFAEVKNQRLYRLDIEKYIRSLPVLIEGETKSQRQQLTSALIDTKRLLSDLELRADEVFDQAFQIFASQYEFFQGNEQRALEIKGLLNVPVVHKRTMDSMSKQHGLPEYVRRHNQLFECVVQTCERLSSELGVSQAMNFVDEVLSDGGITYQEVFSILTDTDPLQAYGNHPSAGNYIELMKYHRSEGKYQELTDTEYSAFTQLSRIKEPTQSTKEIYDLSRRVVVVVDDLQAKLDSPRLSDQHGRIKADIDRISKCKSVSELQRLLTSMESNSRRPMALSQPDIPNTNRVENETSVEQQRAKGRPRTNEAPVILSIRSQIKKILRLTTTKEIDIRHLSESDVDSMQKAIIQFQALIDRYEDYHSND